MLLVPEGVCACTGCCIFGLVVSSLATDGASLSNVCGVFRDTSIPVWLSTGGVNKSLRSTSGTAAAALVFYFTFGHFSGLLVAQERFVISFITRTSRVAWFRSTPLVLEIPG